MAFAKFEKPITDDAGNLVPNVTVTVRKEAAGSPLAALFEDAEGTTPMSNPPTFSDGVCVFYTAGSLGGLRLDAVATGYSKTWRNEPCGTGAQVDVPSIGIGTSNSTVLDIIKLTQTEYDALDPPIDTTLYIIVGA